MFARRLAFALLAAVVAAALTLAGAAVLGAEGWSAWKLGLLACWAASTPWTGICAANGIIGFAILVGTRDPVGAVFPESDAAVPLPPIAIALTVREEDVREALRPVRRLLDELDAAGRTFGVFILSDTESPDGIAREEDAVAAFRAADADPGRIRYRRRAENRGFKAGNVMEFLNHHAAGFEFFLALDADSEMTASAVLRMARAMAADPALGIVQHLTVGRPAAAAFPRLFQFGMRAGMRVWATGQAWWQGDEGPYWGHNALVRVAPFRAHCRLETLPGGATILSHDQVEAARLCAAGWAVRVLPEEAGSQEAHPPALPEHMRRELRWLAGNLQYRHLLFLPGLRPMGRWQLIQAIVLFGGAPLYLGMLIFAAIGAASGGSAAAGATAALILAWMAAIYAPKLAGYAQVLATPELRARYGGAAPFAAGAALEFAFSLLLDPIQIVAKTLCMLRLALGSGPGWTPQNRADRGVTWAEAARLLWPQTLIGIAAFACFAAASWTAVLLALPLAGGLLVAIPFCVLTSAPRAGAWLREAGLAAIPEETPIRPA